MKWLAIVCRVVLGVVFVFSGLMKLNDAWGTTTIVGNYLSFIGLQVEWLNMVIAIGWSTLEFALGVMLLTWVWRRLVAWLAMFIMIGFTALTLFIAIFEPLDDCGCFGAAVRMSSWLSFGKNVVLLVASIWLWKRIKGIEKVNSNWFGGVIGMVTVAFGTGLGVWSYLSLPIVDTFPFSVGTNLRTDVVCTDCMDEATTVIYKNLETEEMVEFGLSDTTWYDTSKWEYVATRVAFDALEEGADEDDFAIYDGADNVASEIIDYEGTTMILFNYDELTISNDNFTDVDKVYRMPAKTREKILRADRGVITIRDGVIVSKEAL